MSTARSGVPVRINVHLEEMGVSISGTPEEWRKAGAFVWRGVTMATAWLRRRWFSSSTLAEKKQKTDETDDTDDAEGLTDRKWIMPPHEGGGLRQASAPVLPSAPPFTPPAEESAPVQAASQPQQPSSSPVATSCPICQDRIVDRVFIPCGHTFCAECAERLADRHLCPLCRSVARPHRFFLSN
jgi:hypothetical protein